MEFWTNRRFFFPFLACCLLAALFAPMKAEGAETRSEVRSVDFYPSGARFVFQAAAALGENFEITLPGAFVPDSVRFLNQGGVCSVRVESAPRDAWTPPALARLKSQIDGKDRELKLLRTRETALEQAKAMLGSPLPKNFGGDGKSLVLYIEDAQAMRLRIENELVDLNFATAKTAKELAVLKAEYDRKIPHGAESVVRIQGVFTGAAGDPLIFQAFTYSAGWTVRYDMSLDSATGDIDTAMRAWAWQSTGLDAVGEFSFHTRQPSFAIAPPAVYPLVVSLQAELLSRGAGASDSVSASAKAMRQAPLNSLMEAEEPLPPSPQMSATLADVSVKGRGGLKGDGTPEDVALGKFTLKSVPVLVAIPEQSREAWIVASMDSIPEPLLPGAAELAVDGAATGKTAIPEYGMGQTYLPFGMASRLTSKKNRLVGKTGSSWLGKGILEDGYTLEITSGMETEREVTVKDRLPLPADDKIALEVTKIDPAPVERDKENRLTWKISVKPGETKKIVVEYTLRYPGEKILTYR
ncbi:MAG: DUF4139 domain-containing protein [Synergistaceae bacterium]|jgi:hypothetical protein|nr:DUF4139 domain-containing protein [Synergistaceae bacterium]